MPFVSMNIFSRLVCVMVLALACVAGTRAQDISASIHGAVTDESGGAVSGAKVTAINIDTGLQRSAMSNAQGVYLVVELPVGHYRVEAEAQGFRKYVQDGISLDV